MWIARIAALAAALTFSRSLGAQREPSLCASDSTAVLAPSISLYCIALVPVPDLRDLAGTVELRRPPSPFTVTVTPEGVHEYELAFTLHGLPAPSTLGPYRSYVAWVTTPNFSDETKLGEVRNGRATLGLVRYNKFIVMITAEASPHERERRGKLVMRAMSPSWLLQPHDGTKLPGKSTDTEHSHHDAQGGWVMPPMHPGAPWMVAGLEALRPKETAWLPNAPGAPMARPRTVMTVADGDSIALSAGLVRRTIAGREIAAYGFNGQYPGPLIRVTQRSTVVVNFTNELDQPTAVHWHGIRLDNRFDGVPHVTQDAVAPGGTFRYVVHFPDAGLYWYHSHHREDIQQDLGLYGNLFVRPDRADYFARADRDEVLMLDDFLLSDDGRPIPYGKESATHALMGRFGNVLLVNGDHDYRLRVRQGEVVRFFLTNASNTRVFNVRLGPQRLKLVGGDVGRPERESWVGSVVIAPAERYIVEARFDRAGTIALVNHVQAIDHMGGRYFTEVDTLGLITVDAAPPRPAAAFETLRTNRDVIADIDHYRPHFSRPPDRTLVLTLTVGDLPFGLVQALRLDTAYVNPVEWSGTMPMMDWLSTAKDITWTLREPSTRRENMEIGWRFRRGEVVKLRLVNDRHTLHPMHHPVHIHGQRFLVLAVNGDSLPNRMWKDTVLIPAGGTVDLLVEMSNPGRWMLHCHIAEHLEAGMHTVFEVR
jgi:suppressor of ftsI